MFEEGNLLFFRPFLFKNGAESQDKFFLVLKKLDGDILLASLPTSKDHVPSDLEVKHGCLNIPERMFNVFVLLSGENVAVREDGTFFAFKKNYIHLWCESGCISGRAVRLAGADGSDYYRENRYIG